MSRLIADPDNDRAEFAVFVRSDLKGRGLGYALMTELLAYARKRGLATIFGDVLRENSTMLQLATELGFVMKPSPNPQIVEITLDLRRRPRGWAQPSIEALDRTAGDLRAGSDQGPGERASSRSSGARPARRLVTKSVFRSAPPKHGIVGAATGTGWLSSSLPSGEKRFSRAADTPALQ